MTTTPKVYAAISAVMAVMSKEGISKDRRNQQQGYNFRGIDDIYNALGSVLAGCKLTILPRVIDHKREERATQKGGVLIYTIMTIEFDLVSAEDGSSHTVRMIGEAMDSADKSSNKAQSAALKYAALQVFMIPTEGDNDADSTTHEVAPKPKAQSRDNYDKLSKENAALETIDKFNAYWAQADIQKTAKSLPADWAEMLRSEKADKFAELDERAALQGDDYVPPTFPGDA